MRPSPSPTASTPSTHTPAERLAAIAGLVDESCAHLDGQVLVHLADAVDEPDAFDLGVRPLPPGVHPFQEVAGLEAPASWWAFGVRVRGRAQHLDRPGGRPERMAVTLLVDRDGQEVSLQRTGRRTTPLTGPAQGTIPDLCRRVLGLPTPAAPASTALLWTSIWLDRLLASWCRPEERRGITSSWAAVASLHPAVSAGNPCPTPEALVEAASAHAEANPWARVRRRADPLSLPAGPLPVEVARWMDDGFFARWAIGSYPSVADVVGDLAPLLGHELGAPLRATARALVDPP